VYKSQNLRQNLHLKVGGATYTRVIHLNNRPLLSLLLAKLASSTSPQKPPATYMQVNDFGPCMDLMFRGATYMRERLVRKYIRY